MDLKTITLKFEIYAKFQTIYHGSLFLAPLLLSQSSCYCHETNVWLVGLLMMHGLVACASLLTWKRHIREKNHLEGKISLRGFLQTTATSRTHCVLVAGVEITIISYHHRVVDTNQLDTLYIYYIHQAVNYGLEEKKNKPLKLIRKNGTDILPIFLWFSEREILFFSLCLFHSAVSAYTQESPSPVFEKKNGRTALKVIGWSLIISPHGVWKIPI